MGLVRDKVALITGGTSGLGKAIALAYAKSSAKVVVFGTNQERLEEVARLVKDAKAQFLGKLVDVSDKKAVEEAVKTSRETFGPVEILINCAGITRDGLLLRMSEEDWDAVLDINLKSVFLTSQAVLRDMMKARKGKIINISSVVGLTGNAGQVNYSASKHGMVGFTKSLAKEVASRNICVNCIAPGFFNTRMTQSLPEEQIKAILSRIPMKRMGEDRDIANAALFLGSDMSNYMTGQVLTIDGGMIC